MPTLGMAAVLPPKGGTLGAGSNLLNGASGGNKNNYTEADLMFPRLSSQSSLSGFITNMCDTSGFITNMCDID